MTTVGGQAADPVRIGAPVYSRDGEALGHVKAVRERHFKVDAPLQPDYWLRRETVAAVTTDGLLLGVGKEQLGGVRVGDPELDSDLMTEPAMLRPPDYAPPTVPPDYAPVRDTSPGAGE